MSGCYAGLGPYAGPTAPGPFTLDLTTGHQTSGTLCERLPSSDLNIMEVVPTSEGLTVVELDLLQEPLQALGQQLVLGGQTDALETS